MWRNERDTVERREPLPDVGVPGGQLQPALLAVGADDDRDVGLDRLRGVADVVELVLGGLVRHLLPAERGPMTIASDSSNQSNRSPIVRPGSMPWARASNSMFPAPSPRIDRPWLTWSIVTAILATRPGLRNVFAATVSPRRMREVAWAHAASVVQPSKNPWYGSPPVE